MELRRFVETASQEEKVALNNRHVMLMAGTVVAASAIAAPALAQVDLKMETWRSEDASIWNETIIPAFEASHPGITITYDPTEPTQYDATLQVKFEGGTAGDIIGCRAFDNPLALYEKGYLASVKDLEAVNNFPPEKLVAWQTDDGSETFCLPMVGTMHGFIYNQDIFNELGLTEQETWQEFYAVLDRIKEDGQYVPLAIGTKDTWAVGTMGYLNIGPQFWKGEKGRLAVIAGEAKLDDPQFLAPLQELAKWGDYMAPGFEAQGYSDSQSLFTLGRAAIYPAGSWEIPGFREQADFEMGAFRVPVVEAGDTCYVTDHTDLGIGMNAATKHPEEVRTFLEWVGTTEFNQLLADALPGLFPLSKDELSFSDPLAAEFASWRNDCEGTIRMNYQILGRGQPNLDADLSQVSANVINGTQTPEEGAAQLQQNLESWYRPSAM
jgi:raffinose/stachyose/melibiose transport system substrate-binding protein